MVDKTNLYDMQGITLQVKAIEFDGGTTLEDDDVTTGDIVADTVSADSVTTDAVTFNRVATDPAATLASLSEGATLKVFKKTVTLATDGATTTVGLTPAGVILATNIIVSTAIAGLDSADHHIQLGVSGTEDKYNDVANGSSATTIAKNKKGFYTGAPVYESAALILTITGGSDQTPSAGAVDVEVLYIAKANLADVA